MSILSSRTNRWYLAGIAVALSVQGCVPYRIHSDYDHEASFDAVRSFAWMDSTRQDEEESTTNPFLERRVRRAVETVMKERGLSTASPETADLLVTAFVIGPTRDDYRTRWAAATCGPSVSVWFGPRYPFGFSRRGTPWFYRSPYWRDPWGYACAYRIGFGYGWLPLYDAPGNRLSGTIVVDVLDRSSRELLWRGSAEGAVLDARTSNQPQEEIDTIIRDVLGRFPPR